MTLLRFLVLTPLALLIMAAGALPWYEQINTDKIWAGEPLSDFFYRLPLMSRPQAAMAYRWLQGEKLDEQRVEQQIEAALAVRPLSPENHLLAARVKYRLGKSSEAAQLAEHAYSLGRTRSYLLWDLAMFWLAFPDQNKAFALLHDYLLAKPRDVKKVLFLAYRFGDNKAALLDTLIPEQPPSGTDYDEDIYAAQILRTALILNNAEMAELGWDRFKARDLYDNQNASVIKSYLHFLIKRDDKQAVFDIWQVMHPDLQVNLQSNSGVMNTSFEQEPLGHGLGWRTDQYKGVSIERDFDESIDGHYSLKIVLDGTENINLHRPSITLPVEGGLRYQLSVYWKGVQVTTRSNPFFEIRYKFNGKNKAIRSQPQRGSWNWRREKLDFEAPVGVNFVEFRLRRLRTKALDKLISGTVYIDDVRLVMVDTHDE